MPRPVPGGWISQGFGPTDEELDGAYGGYAHFNKGIDFAVAAGTAVTATTGGTVISAGDSGDGWGLSVKIRDADGNVHNYGHLSAINVRQGDTIGPSTNLGAVGSTGKSTGPHLSYDVWDSSGTFIDPQQWVDYEEAAGTNGRAPSGVSYNMGGEMAWKPDPTKIENWGDTTYQWFDDGAGGGGWINLATNKMWTNAGEVSPPASAFSTGSSSGGNRPPPVNFGSESGTTYSQGVDRDGSITGIPGATYQRGSNGTISILSRPDQPNSPTDRAPQLTSDPRTGAPAYWDPDNPGQFNAIPGDWGGGGSDPDGDGYDNKTGFPVGVTSFGGKLYYRGQEVNPDGSPKHTGQEAPDLTNVDGRPYVWDSKSGRFIPAPIDGPGGGPSEPNIRMIDGVPYAWDGDSLEPVPMGGRQQYQGSYTPSGGGGGGGGGADAASLARMLFSATMQSQVTRGGGSPAAADPMSEYQRASLDMQREQMGFQAAQAALEREWRQQQAVEEAAQRAQDRAMQDQIAKRGEHTNMRAIANQAAAAYADKISSTDPAAFDAFMAAGGDRDPWDMSIANSLAIPGNHAVSTEAMTPAAKLLANSRNAGMRADQLQTQLGGDVVPMYSRGTPRPSRKVPAYATGTPQGTRPKGMLRRPSPFDRRPLTDTAGVVPPASQPPSSPNVMLGRDLRQKTQNSGNVGTTMPGPQVNQQAASSPQNASPNPQSATPTPVVGPPAPQTNARVSPADQLRALEASGKVRGSGAPPAQGGYSLLQLPAGGTSGQRQGRTVLQDASGRTVYDPYASLKQGPGREVTLEDMVRQYEQKQGRDQFFAGGNEWNDLGLDFDTWREMKGTAERLGIDTNRRDWFEPWAAAGMEYADWQKMGQPTANWMRVNPGGSIEDYIQQNANGSWNATKDDWGMDYYTPPQRMGGPSAGQLDPNNPAARYTDESGREWYWEPEHGFRNPSTNPDYHGHDKGYDIVTDYRLMSEGPKTVPMPTSQPPTQATWQTPGYAQGTRGGHPGGPAVVGDSIDRRPNPEMVREPGRRPYMVNTPQLMPNMPRGTEVVPLRADMRAKGAAGYQRTTMAGPRAYAFGVDANSSARLPGNSGMGISQLPLVELDATREDIERERARRAQQGSWRTRAFRGRGGQGSAPAPAPAPAPTPTPVPVPGGGTNTGGGGTNTGGGGTNTGGGGTGTGGTGTGTGGYVDWEDLLNEVHETRTGATFRDLWDQFYDPRYNLASPTIRDRFEKGYQGKFGIPQEDLQAEGYRYRPQGLSRRSMAIGR